MTTDPIVPVLQKYFNVEYVTPVGRAALGITVALQAWSAGRKLVVAMPAAVCQDVIAAVLLAGGHPFFCDIDPLTGLVIENEWRRARQNGANAAVMVHLYGNPADMRSVRSIFPINECLLIDDAAQAFGAKYNGKLAGMGGDIGIISFGKTKHIEVGGAALLIQDRNLAIECASVLRRFKPASESARERVTANFSINFQAARENLVISDDISGFNNLLTHYSPALHVEWNSIWSERIVEAVINNHQHHQTRLEKARIWQQYLDQTALVRVGMVLDDGCSPWRYVCRLPGSDWKSQRKIGNQLRRQKIHVSHWYLPGNWLLGVATDKLRGTEQLASEVFQFWIDEQTSAESIKAAGEYILENLTISTEQMS
jgi:dTDP-4-amino-4,6-dideoxygalactose transaminase